MSFDTLSACSSWIFFQTVNPLTGTGSHPRFNLQHLAQCLLNELIVAIAFVANDRASCFPEPLL